MICLRDKKGTLSRYQREKYGKTGIVKRMKLRDYFTLGYIQEGYGKNGSANLISHAFSM